MTILVLGGTRFIGAAVVRRLVAGRHEVAVFHRGQTEAPLPDAVLHIHGDRAALDGFRPAFERLAPDVLLDAYALTEADAQTATEVLGGLVPRAVVLSSQDVYRAYDRFTRRDPGPPDPTPLDEAAPLRRLRYPYRAHAPGAAHPFYDYDKIFVENIYRDNLPAATVLRLPPVYGPGDAQHRFGPYLDAMRAGEPEIRLARGQADWRWTRGYVENVAAAIVVAIEHEAAAGEVFNVGEAEARPEAAWIRELGALVGWHGAIVEHNAPDEAHDWQQQMAVDTAKIRRLGYRPVVARADALRETIAWEEAQRTTP